ncbi:MAG TPA: methyltransferase domain-containing protein [Terriglobales bacterium]|nr:methyltransferase domain-containing protein [Terriglobales bacterium]
MQAIQAIRKILPDGIRDLADAAFVSRGRRHIIRTSTRAVDDEYACGRWDYLGSLEEMTRYAVIAGYCRYGGGASSVLDLGCGFGLLRRWLGPPGAVEYVGVELSNLAIEAARVEWTDARTKFVATDAATYVADRKFDMIVFNEVLYYFERPDEILGRFASVLTKGGRFVISLWASPESRLAWRRAHESVRVVDEVQVKHHSGVSWQIRLCEPHISAP